MLLRIPIRGCSAFSTENKTDEARSYDAALVRDNNSLDKTETTSMQNALQRERRAIQDWRSREVYRIGPSYIEALRPGEAPESRNAGHRS